MRRTLTLAALVGSAIALGQDVIKPTDNLVVKGIPAVPADVARQVGRYTEFRTASVVDWHPTRRELLVSTRFGNTAQIHRVSSPGAARFQLTFFPD
ncbi:MAG TPA: hypothetical protein VEX38_09995, partial [Fimbriimonadaceae bacterium]|nr:hypothetical protein [Fimbriimonadaceae bacterium]